MEIPKIEKEFIKKRNRLASAVGFLGIGIGALATTKGLGAIPLCFVAIPLAIDVFTLNSLGKDKKKSPKGLSLYKPFFQLSMKKWIKKYLDKSDNVHEKKYKYMFLSAWLEHKKIQFDNISFSDFNVFRVFKKEIDNNELSRNQIAVLSNNEVSFVNRYKKFNQILEEDKHFPERIEIAKKIYEEYSNLGIAGQAFLDNKEIDIFAYLQNYKFTDKDYELILRTELVIDEHPLFRIDIDEYSNSNLIALKRIIANESDIAKLEILKDFFRLRLLQADKSIDNVISVEELKKEVQKKIEYIEFGQELEIKPEKPKKTNKTKI